MKQDEATSKPSSKEKENEKGAKEETEKEVTEKEGTNKERNEKSEEKVIITFKQEKNILEKPEELAPQVEEETPSPSKQKPAKRPRIEDASETEPNLPRTLRSQNRTRDDDVPDKEERETESKDEVVESEKRKSKRKAK